MAVANRLLECLEGVRQVGQGRWLARCPAHEDRRPSLSILEREDGRVLLHCFAGCETAAVLSAVDLRLADLFPERLGHHLAPARDRRHQHAAREALRLVSVECLVVTIAAERLARGAELTPPDRERLHEAAVRIRTARELTG